MKPTRASRRIRKLVRAGHWEILAHAVAGADLLDEPLVLIVELRANVLVVSMFRGDE